MKITVWLTVTDGRTFNNLNNIDKVFEVPFLLSEKDGSQKILCNPEVVKWVLGKKNRVSNYVSVFRTDDGDYAKSIGRFLVRKE